MSRDTCVKCSVSCVTANKTTCVYPDLLCASTGACMSVHLLCDGKFDCPDNSDEGPLCGQFSVLSHTSLNSTFYSILFGVTIMFEAGLDAILQCLFSHIVRALCRVHSSLSNALLLHIDHKIAKYLPIIFPFNFWLSSFHSYCHLESIFTNTSQLICVSVAHVCPPVSELAYLSFYVMLLVLDLSVSGITISCVFL